MSHSSLYLTNLYNDLITNTPQTITMDIPSEVGQGQISQTKIKHGVILSDWKMCYQSDMNVQGPVSGEYMQIIFCLNDGISWGIMNENRSITIQKNESCIYAGHDGTEYICYKKDSNFSFKSIKIPIPYFSQLLADYFDGQEITVYEKKLLNGIAKVSVTPIMEQILSEIFTIPRGAGLSLFGRQTVGAAVHLSGRSFGIGHSDGQKYFHVPDGADCHHGSKTDHRQPARLCPLL